MAMAIWHGKRNTQLQISVCPCRSVIHTYRSACRRDSASAYRRPGRQRRRRRTPIWYVCAARQSSCHALPPSWSMWTDEWPSGCAEGKQTANERILVLLVFVCHVPYRSIT
ncbi:hypothetical protein BS78_09G068400 [Paspalum vaginatum]|nr:hypothetical protein BS78_09G068400 [Paspalum vaginatum]